MSDPPLALQDVDDLLHRAQWHLALQQDRLLKHFAEVLRQLCGTALRAIRRFQR